MELSKEQLKEITSLSEAMLPLNDIALIINVDYTRLQRMFDAEGNVRNAVMKGRLLCKAKINQAIITSAQQGSNPAQQLAMSLLSEVDKDDFD